MCIFSCEIKLHKSLKTALFKYHFALLILIVSAAKVHAADNEQPGAAWLYDFFSKGIQSAYAEYSMAITKPPGASDQYYEQMHYSIEYIAADKTYDLRYSYDYRDDWNILTHNGSIQPPRPASRYNGSRIQPWTNSNGLGIYSEKYERKIQNWLVFDDLDSLLMMHSKMGNPLPGISGIFFPDELKHLKKLYKESLTAGQEESVCKGFDFDHNGNVAGISRNYLTGFGTRKTNDIKNLESYTLSIRNQQEDVVFIEVLTHGSKYPMLEGLQFKCGDKKCVVFSFELNRLFCKFVPELVADPDYLITEYLHALQEATGKPLARFESTASK